MPVARIDASVRLYLLQTVAKVRRYNSIMTQPEGSVSISSNPPLNYGFGNYPKRIENGELIP